MQFALDANVFIQAHRIYYRFGVVPGFWASLLWQHGAGQVCSIDRVRDELVVHADMLSDWTQHVVPATCFQSTDDGAVIAHYGTLMNWAQGQAQFTPAAKAEFATKADAWLIAYAMANKLTVVTMEVFNREIKKKIPIPNVCQAFGVPHIETFEMLSALGVAYSWTAPQ